MTDFLKSSKSQASAHKRKSLEIYDVPLQENGNKVLKTNDTGMEYPTNSRWSIATCTSLNKTPISSGKKSLSRLSRKNSPAHQKTFSASNLNTSLESPPSKKSPNVYSPTDKNSFSPSGSCITPTRNNWCSSQDPSREIIWDNRPLSPLTQSSSSSFVCTNILRKKSTGDLMTNLCSTWKFIGKASSPVGSDTLLNQWIKKPETTPVKSSSRNNIVKRKETPEHIKTAKNILNLTKELQRVNQLINGDQEIGKKKSPILTEQNLAKDISFLKNGEKLEESFDLFHEEVLAPDSCEIFPTSDEELWGDDDDNESFIRKLSQAELSKADQAFIELPTQPAAGTVPSTLTGERSVYAETPSRIFSSSGVNIEISKPLEKVCLTDNATTCKLKFGYENLKLGEKNKCLKEQNKQVESDKVSNNEQNGHCETELIDIADSYDDDDDLFGDDNDFGCLSQEVLSLLDQKPISPTQWEPTISQKRRATAQEIMRKKEEALKLRKNKMQKVASFHSTKSMKNC